MGLRTAALFAGVAASVGMVAFAKQYRGHEIPPPSVIGAMAPKGEFSATVGCAAASCHGSGAIGKPAGEYSTWIESDPHTKAYQVLRNEDSQRISKNLGRTTPSYQDAECLKCHAVDGPRYHQGEKVADHALDEGIGCDGCHGPSAKWASLHYTPFWKTLSFRERYEQFGFVPLGNDVTRVLTCAKCHVGGRDREVNHDLIAAGHPRLSFEYTRFHYSDEYKLKHWVEKTPNPAFEYHAWLAGQVASLRAAVELLEARAERAGESKAPWPEFAESTCYACHQNLGPDLRGNTTNALHPRKPGVLGWQLWYTSFAKAMPKLVATKLDSLDPLRIEMEKPVPNPQAVAKLAKAALGELDGLLSNLQSVGPSKLENGDVRELAAIVAEGIYDPKAGKLRDYDWDVLTQHALALTALYHAAGGAANPAVAGWKPHLLDVRTKLAFPKAGGRVDSPRDFKPADVYASFRTLYELTH